MSYSRDNRVEIYSDDATTVDSRLQRAGRVSRGSDDDDIGYVFKFYKYAESIAKRNEHKDDVEMSCVSLWNFVSL